MTRSIINFSPVFKAVCFIVFHFLLVLDMILNWLAYSLSVKGRFHLKTGKALLVSNHSLYMEPGIVAHAIFPKRSYFSVLEETMNTPGLGILVRFLGGFPVSERMPLGTLIPAVKRALEEKWFVHFFPEGEINPGEKNLKPFKDGVFFLSCLLRVPIIPIVNIVSKRRIFGRSLPFLPPKVRTRIGKPIYPELFLKDKTSLKKAYREMKMFVWERMNSLLAD